MMFIDTSPFKIPLLFLARPQNKLYLLIIVLCLFISAVADETQNKNITHPLNWELGKDYTAITTNNWVYWHYNNGYSALEPYSKDLTNGSRFPQSGANIIFQDGIVWGARVNGEVRVGGNTYISGTVPVLNKIYRIRPDILNITLMELKREVGAIFNVEPDLVTDEQLNKIYQTYLFDLENWPVHQGAPWEDLDGDGVYSPDVDRPGIANAAQIVFCVIKDTNSALVQYLYGSDPLGIRANITLWAYGNPDARFGQVVFKRIQIKNISSTIFDEMYVAHWADVNVGSYYDDVVGCDSVLGLAYAYNGYDVDDQYAKYNMAPAAVGYDVIQGPLVPATGEIGRSGFQFVQDYTNLSMTSFCYWPSGNALYDDPDLGSYRGTLQWYNLMRGFLPLEDLENPIPFRHATNNAPTKFPVNGDPLTGTGEIDGVNNGFSPGARRMAMVSGPFDLQPDEEQDIIFAIIGGRPGETRLDAVRDLKITDHWVQAWADTLFLNDLIKTPSFDVEISEFPGRLLLNWGMNPAKSQQLESTIFTETAKSSYQFVGYVVYQLTDASAENKIPIATFDKIDGITTIYDKKFFPEYGEFITVPVFHGKETGIQRYLVVTRDFIHDAPLYNGRVYYYEISAVFYNPHPQLTEKTTMNFSRFISGIPQTPPPGFRYADEIGTELPVEHIAGVSDARVRVKVIDPSRLTGHTYQITFVPGDQDSLEYVWNLTDVTTGRDVLGNQPLANSFVNPDGQQAYADGLEIVVEKIPVSFSDFSVIANGNGLLPEPEPAAFPYQGFPVKRMPGDEQQVGNGIWIIAAAPLSITSFNDFLRVTTMYSGGFNHPVHGLKTLVPDDYEIRFTDKSVAFFNWSTATLDSVPFQLWNIGDANDPADDFQVFPMIQELEHLQNLGEFNITNRDHKISAVRDDPATDVIYFIQPVNRSPGSQGYREIVSYIQQNPAGVPGDSLWKYAKAGLSIPALGAMTLVNWNGGYIPQDEQPWQTYPYNQLLPEPGTIFRIATTNPVSTEDIFQFTTPPVVRNDVVLERADVQRVSVFPNPYLGDQLAPDGALVNQVTFSHLPRRATIRIFNLAGQLVVTLKKDDPSQYLRWNLQNSSGRPVASGIYIAYIKMWLSDNSIVEKSIKLFIQNVQRNWAY